MLWWKAFHIIFVVTWFAALFYLPRLFVYHASAENSQCDSVFKTMEHKLYHYIMTPSAILATLCGLNTMHYSLKAYLAAPWMHAKLSFVIALALYHGMCGYYVKQFARDKNTHSHRYYRVFNEIPSLILIAVVLLVVLKPTWS